MPVDIVNIVDKKEDNSLKNQDYEYYQKFIMLQAKISILKSCFDECKTDQQKLIFKDSLDDLVMLINNFTDIMNKSSINLESIMYEVTVFDVNKAQNDTYNIVNKTPITNVIENKNSEIQLEFIEDRNKEPDTNDGCIIS